MKYFFGCLASFLVFAYLPILVGTFEAADIVIMDDDIRKIAKVMKISKKTMAIVKENIVFALGVKGLVLVLGAIGMASMWAAVFADVGVAVIAILNSMRTLRK